MIEVPTGKLEWALNTLDEGERWLVKPRELPGGGGRYWTPGIRVGVKPGSRFHLEEFFGPVLGIMYASSLNQAIRMQNAVTSDSRPACTPRTRATSRSGSTEFEAGNLYVNRGITGAVVQRQPFGGWKRSSVGPRPKGRRTELPDRSGHLARHVGRTGIEVAAPARARHPVSRR